jgi:hypothetical protein
MVINSPRSNRDREKSRTDFFGTTPKPSLSGFPHRLWSLYSCCMHSRVFRFMRSDSLLAQPGTRADARNGIIPLLGGPSRASQFIR